MAPKDLGIRIRRARERLRWTQQQLADKLPPDPNGRRVGVRSVGRWERGEAVPRNAIGALEAALGISLSEDGGQPEVPTDPEELALWNALSYMDDPAERWRVIGAVRQARDQAATG